MLPRFRFLAGAFACLLFQTAHAVDPEAVAERLRQANEILEAWPGANLNEARQILEEVIAVDPGSSPAYYALARYHVKAGYVNNKIGVKPPALAAAEQAARRAVALDPHYASAYTLLAEIYRRGRRFDEARAMLVLAEASDPRDYFLDLQKAELELAVGNYPEGERLFRAMMRSPDPAKSGQGLVGLLHIFSKQRRFEELDALYQAEFAKGPAGDWAHVDYASFRVCDLNDFESAIEHITTAIELDGPSGIHRHILATALYMKWADRIQHNDLAGADESHRAAYALVPQLPAATVAETCRNGPAIKAFNGALRRQAQLKEQAGAVR